MNLEFQQLNYLVNITCISDDGVVKDIDEIKSELEDEISDVISEIILENNNVVAFELHESTGGDSV